MTSNSGQSDKRDSGELADKVCINLPAVQERRPSSRAYFHLNQQAGCITEFVKITDFDDSPSQQIPSIEASPMVKLRARYHLSTFEAGSRELET